MKLKKKKDNKFNKKINAFLPIYINKNKLLDINSILFNGYSEFSEETLETENNQVIQKEMLIQGLTLVYIN